MTSIIVECACSPFCAYMHWMQLHVFCHEIHRSKVTAFLYCFVDGLMGFPVKHMRLSDRFKLSSYAESGICSLIGMDSAILAGLDVLDVSRETCVMQELKTDVRRQLKAA